MGPYGFTILLLTGFVGLLSVAYMYRVNRSAVVGEVGPIVHTKCGPVEGENVNGVYSFQVSLYLTAIYFMSISHFLPSLANCK